MKIKTKLIISFFMIILIPIALACITLYGFQNIQMKAIEKTYGISNVDAYSLFNSGKLLDGITEETYQQLVECAKENPENLTDSSYLETVDADLVNKHSYLVVSVEDAVIYNGGEDNYALINQLLDYQTQNHSYSFYEDGDEEILVKQVNFETDNKKGCAYIISSSVNLLPEVKKLVWDLILAVVVILLFTACAMIVWIYRSMITPIRKLQDAAENIKDGNLDFSIDVSGDDEIGELGETFEQMRQRLKLNAEEKISDEKESRALISNIAHDLKTPITAVKGYSEGILDGVANTPEKIDKYVRTIYNKANEMDTLINELTIYTKIDTNRIPYNFAKINVSSYFADCVEEIGLDLEAKGIGLAYYNYAEDDTVIIADPEQLRRVINNIIGNSVKYMNRSNGFINVRIKDVGDFIQVELEDNGRGIAQKDLPYIFDRFYRADASRNSATGGSGIGLSIVKKIIEDHGGKIWATSKEDTGTTMYFVIRKYQEVPNE